MVGTIFVVPIVAIFNGDTHEAMQNLWDDIGGKAAVGGTVSLVGLAATVTGTILLVKGNRNLTRTVKYLNESGIQKEAEFAFGPTFSGGIGLSLTF